MEGEPTVSVEEAAGLTAITRIGVVGSGTRGAGIAELCALRGLDVRLCVSRESSLTTAPARVAASLDRQVGKGRIGPAERDAALARITLGTDLADLADRDLVIEAGPEDEAVKFEPSRGWPAPPPGPRGSSASTSSTRSACCRWSR